VRSRSVVCESVWDRSGTVPNWRVEYKCRFETVRGPFGLTMRVHSPDGHWRGDLTKRENAARAAARHTSVIRTRYCSGMTADDFVSAIDGLTFDENGRSWTLEVDDIGRTQLPDSPGDAADASVADEGEVRDCLKHQSLLEAGSRPPSL
jgi:hypothetical protein